MIPLVERIRAIWQDRPIERWQKIDKFSRPYIRLLRGDMYNTLAEHRRGCGCDRCNKARARHEAIGVLVERITDAAHDVVVWDCLDALAEILKRRPYSA